MGYIDDYTSLKLGWVGWVAGSVWGGNEVYLVLWWCLKVKQKTESIRTSFGHFVDNDVYSVCVPHSFWAFLLSWPWWFSSLGFDCLAQERKRLLVVHEITSHGIMKLSHQSDCA